MSQLIAIELIDFILSALLLVAVFKIPALRNRTLAGLNVAMSYLSGYFKSTQIVNIPEPDHRQELIKAAITGLLSNPGIIVDETNIKEFAEKIADAMLHVKKESFDDHDGEPNYSADEDDCDDENHNGCDLCIEKDPDHDQEEAFPIEE